MSRDQYSSRDRDRDGGREGGATSARDGAPSSRGDAPPPSSRDAPSSSVSGDRSSTRPAHDPQASVNYAKIWVGNLDTNIDPRKNEEDLKKHFAKYFPVRVDAKGVYAFVECEEEVDAADAIKYMDGTTMGDRRLSVRPIGPPKHLREQYGGGRGGYSGGYGGDRGGYGGYSRGGGEFGRGGYGAAPSGDRPPGVAYGHRVEIENVAERTSWQDLKDFGRQAGESIKYADIFHMDAKGKCGVISFAVKEEADRAIEILNGQNLDGNVLAVYPDRGTFPTRSSGSGAGRGGYSGPPRGGYRGGYGGGEDRHGGGDRYGSPPAPRGGYGGGGYGGGYNRDSGYPPRDNYGGSSGSGGYGGGFGDSYGRGGPSYDAPAQRRRSPSPQKERERRERDRSRTRSRSPRKESTRDSRVERDSRDVREPTRESIRESRGNGSDTYGQSSHRDRSPDQDRRRR